MSEKISEIHTLLQVSSTVPEEKRSYFFKTDADNYAAHDQFMGVSVPNVRLIAKKFLDLSSHEIEQLLASPFNEERLLGLIILVHQYQKATTNKDALYQLYMNNLKQVDNWNLVDASAHLILGAHLDDKNKDILIALAKSDDLWERRIAIIATWYFIRNNDLVWTFKIATLLLNDTHDLIHKSVGWMLREAGKKNTQQLIDFLDAHASDMPRTMLRYAIEKFPETQRKAYLRMTKTNPVFRSP